MKIVLAGERGAGSAYLAEILRTFGLCCLQETSANKAVAAARETGGILVLPPGVSADGDREFLQTGGTLVAIQPPIHLEEAAGLKRQGLEQGPCRLRFVQPVCPGSRGEPLWTLGRRIVYGPHSGPDVLANFFTPGAGQAPSRGRDVGAGQQVFYAEDNPAILRRTVGAGHLTVFAYDPAETVSLLRQGLPERANHLPEGHTFSRPYFLQHPHPPQDTQWRPHADLHALALAEILKGLLGERFPVPHLWHLPQGASSLLLFTDDEDGATPEENLAEMTAVESAGGSMTLYVIPNNTSLTADHVQAYNKRGHTVSIHPYLKAAAGRSVEEQIAEAEKQLQLFAIRLNQPVHTVRNDSTMWPGYLELPELWARHGIGMDANFFACMYGESLEWGPFAKVHSALPMRFVRPDGTLIDVFQQPTHLSDDLVTHPEKMIKYSAGEMDAVFEGFFDEAIRWTHSPFCVVFHSGNFASFSRDACLRLLDRAQALGLPIWSLDRWHDFWRARADWTMTDLGWRDGRLGFTLAGPPCESLTFLLPATWKECRFRSVSIDGEPARTTVALRRRREVIQTVLPAGASCIRIEALYS